MTNKEINEAVVRKLGWEPIAGSMARDQDNLKKRPIYVPDYCHSIEAAWEIIDVANISWQLMKRSDGSWFAALSTNSQAVDYREATADTASMAIVKAFLKLTEGK